MQISGAHERGSSRASAHIIDFETLVVKHGDFGQVECIADTKVVVQNRPCAHLCAIMHYLC